MRAVLLAFLLCSCTAERAPLVQGAYAAAVPPSLEVSAVYFNVKNPTGEALVLTGVEASKGEEATLMITTRQSSDGEHAGPHHTDLIGMADVHSLTVPPRRTHPFEPGGDHVMLRGLTGGLPVGEVVHVTLFLESGETLRFEAEARLP